MHISPRTVDQKAIKLRKPTASDGMNVFTLVENCPPLDPNSSYCNLLQCHHFASTSILAEIDNEIAGFVSGYLLPESPNTLFIWQVAVSDKARGKGLAIQMLTALLHREACSAVTRIETTITESNSASWALFNKLANQLKAQLQKEVLFDKHTHFNDRHDSEILVTIGPLHAEAPAR